MGQDDSGDLVALQNGCICCTLRTDLIRQISDLIESARFDYIVIEASGVCEPAPIAQTICSMEQMVNPARTDIIRPRMDAIVTVVDALRMKSEFGCGENLDKERIEEEDIENLIIEQIEFCNIILLNKISEVTQDEAAHIKAVIRALQPKARIMECDYCDVNLSEIIDTRMFDFEDVATSATWVEKIEKPAEEQEHHHITTIIIMNMDMNMNMNMSMNAVAMMRDIVTAVIITTITVMEKPRNTASAHSYISAAVLSTSRSLTAS